MQRLLAEWSNQNSPFLIAKPTIFFWQRSPNNILSHIILLGQVKEFPNSGCTLRA